MSVRGREVWLAAQVDDHVVWAHSADGGQTFGTAAAGRLAGGDLAAVDRRRPTAGHAYLAWIDTRDRFALDDLPQARALRRAAAGRGAGSASTRPRRPTTSRARSTTPGRRASPPAGKTVVLAWIDFHSYDWDVLARPPPATAAPRSATRTRSTSRPKANEALEASPHAAIAGAGPAGRLHRLAQAPDSAPRAELAVRHRARGMSASIRARSTAPGARHVNAFWPAVARRPRGALVAWQDMRRGVGEIRLARVGRSGVAPDRRSRGRRAATPGARRSPCAGSTGNRRLGGRPRRPVPDLHPPDAATLQCRVARERRPPTK